MKGNAGPTKRDGKLGEGLPRLPRRTGSEGLLEVTGSRSGALRVTPWCHALAWGPGTGPLSQSPGLADLLGV